MNRFLLAITACCVLVFSATQGAPVPDAHKDDGPKKGAGPVVPKNAPFSIEENAIPEGALRRIVTPYAAGGLVCSGRDTFLMMNTSAKLVAPGAAPGPVPPPPKIEVWTLSPVVAMHPAIKALAAKKAVQHVTISPDGTHAVLFIDKEDPQLVNLKTGKEVPMAPLRKGFGEKDKLSFTSFSGNGRYAAFTLYDEKFLPQGMAFYDSSTGKSEAIRSPLHTPLWMSGDGRFLSVLDKRAVPGSPFVIYENTGKLRYPLKKEDPPLNGGMNIQTSKDGKRVVLMTRNPAQARIYELPTWKHIRDIALPPTNFSMPTLSPNGETLIVTDIPVPPPPGGDWQKGLRHRAFEVATGEEIAELPKLAGGQLQRCGDTIVRERIEPNGGLQNQVYDVFAIDDLLVPAGKFAFDPADKAFASKLASARASESLPALAQLKKAGISRRQAEAFLGKHSIPWADVSKEDKTTFSELATRFASETFKVRDSASRAMNRLAGTLRQEDFEREVLPTLTKLSASADLEVRRRADDIIARYGSRASRVLLAQRLSQLDPAVLP